MSLEDVIHRKHNYRMLLADRVKPDLIAAVKATHPAGDTAKALALLAKWDNTAAPKSRGGTLFEIWWQQYSRGLADSLRYQEAWSAAKPTRTPRGLKDPARAAAAFGWAVTETARRFGRWDVAWGDVHRVLVFRQDADGKLVATGSDGWILAVEFGDVPRAYSVLAYGESPREDSPWFSDQAEMFARGRLKKVDFLARDVDKDVIVRYRPGEQ